MPGGHPNARHPADTRADPIIAKMLADGYLDTGESRDYLLPSHDAANQVRLSFNRSARRQNFSPGAWVASEDGQPCDPRKHPCPAPDSPHYARLKLWAKNAGRTHIFRQTGGDPSQLKYNPWARKGRRYDDTGRPA